MISMDERAPLTALEFLLAIRFEKVDDKRGRPAAPQVYSAVSGGRLTTAFPSADDIIFKFIIFATKVCRRPTFEPAPLPTAARCRADGWPCRMRTGNIAPSPPFVVPLLLLDSPAAADLIPSHRSRPIPSRICAGPAPATSSWWALGAGATTRAPNARLWSCRWLRAGTRTRALPLSLPLLARPIPAVYRSPRRPLAPSLPCTGRPRRPLPHRVLSRPVLAAAASFAATSVAAVAAASVTVAFSAALAAAAVTFTSAFSSVFSNASITDAVATAAAVTVTATATVTAVPSAAAAAVATAIAAALATTAIAFTTAVTNATVTAAVATAALVSSAAPAAAIAAVLTTAVLLAKPDAMHVCLWGWCLPALVRTTTPGVLVDGHRAQQRPCILDAL